LAKPEIVGSGIRFRYFISGKPSFVLAKNKTFSQNKPVESTDYETGLPVRVLKLNSVNSKMSSLKLTLFSFRTRTGRPVT
jgi:hypothetical protein